ncbi:MAG: hypothetical protein ACYS74_13845 [Planctomycetota bacterium]
MPTTWIPPNPREGARIVEGNKPPLNVLCRSQDSAWSGSYDESNQLSRVNGWQRWWITYDLDPPNR